MSQNYTKIQVVRDYFLGLQSQITERLEHLDGQERFSQQRLNLADAGFSQPRVLSEGKLFEKAAANFTFSKGSNLPSAATNRRPDLAGTPFQATSISVIVHPWNPNIPTTHMNLRMFLVESNPEVWYFGGGFDLTPFLPHLQDFVRWHKLAKKACGSHSLYTRLKKQCDEYFYLSHRKETRGIGGLFFDDFDELGFDSSLEFVQRIGDRFIEAYTEIVQRNVDSRWSSEDEEWMLLRRGRYAEFNLAIDRGTKYGMQSGRRIESVLVSLPPRAKWVYQFEPKPGSPQAKLLEFLQPGIDWENIVENSVEN